MINSDFAGGFGLGFCTGFGLGIVGLGLLAATLGVI